MSGAVRAPGVQLFREIEALTLKKIKQANHAFSANKESVSHQTLTTFTDSCHQRKMREQHDDKQDAGITCWTE